MGRLMMGVRRGCTVALATCAASLTGCTSSTTPAPDAASPTTAELPTTASPSTAPSVSPGTTSSSVAATQCRSSDLTVSLGATEGAAGSVYRVLVFTNRGNRSCELQGFPGVSYVAGDDGHQVGSAAARTGDRGKSVPIAPGGTASAQLRQVNVANFDAATCQPTPVRGLRVYPPGETAAIFVPLGGTGCAGTPSGPQLTVQAVTAS